MSADKKDIPTPEETDKNTEERLDEEARQKAEEVVAPTGDLPAQAGGADDPEKATPEEEKVKKTAKKAEKKKTEEKAETKKEKDEESAEEEGRTLKKDEYIEGLGRRKRATARVRIYSAEKGKAASNGGFEVNGQSAEDFFVKWQQEVSAEPLERVAMADKLRVTVQVKGGGPTGQAEATRMGLSRALVELEPSFKGKLKRAGFLTRDPREKERKKPGLKKARRAPQFSKR